VYFLKKKFEIFEHLKYFKAHVETQFRRKIKIIRTDNKVEYVNRYVQHLFSKEIIQLQDTVPYTPQQNKVVERKNRTLKEMVIFMLHVISLPPNLSAKALNWSNHIYNISPQKYVKDQTPFEAWSDSKPEVTHFQIFGSRAWAHVSFENRKELNP
jgi:transposase InsO family protein